MLKNVKIGTKLIGGFVIVAAIVLAVGAVGWNGTRQLDGHLNEIGEVRLPSIESLLVIESEANSIRTSLRSIINPFVEGSDRERQYANISASRERYEEAWAVYEPLPQTDAEAVLWDTFVAAWNTWRESNNTLIELVKQAEDSGIANPDRFVATMEGFIKDHHILMGSAQNYLLTGASFVGGDDPTACNFGKWMASTTIDNEEIAAILKSIRAPHDRFHESIGEIKDKLSFGDTDGAISLFRTVVVPSAEEVFAWFDELFTIAEEVKGLFESAALYGLGENRVAQNKANELLERIVTINEEVAAEAKTESARASKAAQTTAIVGMLAGLVIALLLGITISLGITRPIGQGVAFAQKIALGELDIDLSIDQKDEVGVLADAMREMLAALRYKADLVERVAEGDLTIDVELASDEDGLGKSLVAMAANLNELLTQVREAIDQVSSGSNQVSQASQSLSQGATEQASSLEEISSSLAEINSQSKLNAENAGEANTLAKKAAEDADEGNAKMKELLDAMARINASSEEIGKVVKVIDDIAFQINLLALNANVEAARAGKYGKGFAVVADEVRNLAVRSAGSVKETTAMVEETIRNISEGTKSAELTATQLEAITSGAGKVAQLLGEIALASREQAQGVEQINSGLDQIDQVTQANTASAEESASAAEELASQSQQLQGMIERFKLRTADDDADDIIRLADARYGE